MEKTIITTGKTIELAIEAALQQLGLDRDSVSVQVLSQAKPGFLGFGATPARVEVTYEAPDPAPEAPKSALTSASRSKPKPTYVAPKKEEPKVEAPAPKAEKAAEAEKPAEVKTSELKKVNIADSASLTSAAEYLTAVLKGMGVAELSIEAFRTQEDEIIFELDCGDDYGIVIGRRGDTLDSIQYLTRLVANKQKQESEYLRITINVGNYREKRKTTLRELAKKNSEKVLKYGRNVTFEPMNPYERRIIHTAVQEIEGVTSYSVGADAGRRVVISLEEGVKPTHPSKGGYNRGRAGKGGYNRGGRGRNNSSRQSAPAAPTRAPRTDAGAEKVSLYGKIN